MSLQNNRLLCAILALVALAHALLPDGPVLARASGSAFSAATADVAIGCDTRLDIDRRFLPDRPPPPPPPVKCSAVAAKAAPVLPSVPVDGVRGFAATLVDLPALLTQLSPRAPPAA